MVLSRPFINQLARVRESPLNPKPVILMILPGGYLWPNVNHSRLTGAFKSLYLLAYMYTQAMPFSTLETMDGPTSHLPPQFPG